VSDLPSELPTNPIRNSFVAWVFAAPGASPAAAAVAAATSVGASASSASASALFATAAFIRTWQAEHGDSELEWES
jgi:hypothetical protein